MLRYSKWMMALIAIVTIFSLIGCQTATQAPTAAPAQPTTAAAQPTSAPAKPAEVKTVRVLTMQQAGPTPDEMNAIVAEFNKVNQDVKVEIEYVSYDALHDKITTAMSANPPAYDVVLVDDIWYAEFAKAGYVKDVTALLTPDMKSKVFKAAWDITTVNGVTYGMPWLLDQKYFFYNDKILKDAGFNAPPKTWQELIDMAKVIKQKGLVEYPIAWSWAQAEAAVCDWVTLLYSNGGSFLDDKGQPAFNNDLGVQTLTWMVNSIKDGISNPASSTYVEEDVRNVFSQGKAAFALNWNYMYDLANNSTTESKVTGQVKVATIPAFKAAADKGILSSSINGSMGFSVIAKSPNADAAWKYVEYLTSEDVQNRYSAHMLPIWQSSFEGDMGKKLAAISPATQAMVPAFNAQFPTAHVRPKVPFYQEFSKNLQLAMQEAFGGQKTPKEALDEAAAKWVELAGK